MAARTRRIFNDANTRAKIQTTQIVKRLADHIHGEVKLSSTQIRAAEILLNKTLPNLSNVEISGEINTVATATDTLRALNANGHGLRDGVPDSGAEVAPESGDIRH